MQPGFGLKIRTMLPYAVIEKMLGESCRKNYRVALGDVEETKEGPCKVLRVYFEEAGDMARFREAFRSRRIGPPFDSGSGRAA